MTLPDRQPGENADEPRPWEGLGQVPRDCPPHRANLLTFLSRVSVGCGILSVLLCVPAIPGFVVGLVTLVLADRDLARMAARRMDPSGREETEAARRRSNSGVALSVLGPVGFGILWVLLVALVRVLLDSR